MNKMISFVFVALLLSSCSVTTYQNIDNLELKAFTADKDFNSKELQKYKVGKSVICPIFRNLDEKDIYSLNIAAYSDVEGEKTFCVYSIKIIITIDGDEKVIEKNTNEKNKYKLSSDKTYWKKDVYYAGQKVYETLEADFKLADTIKLIADVGVADANGEERKIIEYDLQYSEDKYITELSQ